MSSATLSRILLLFALLGMGLLSGGSATASDRLQDTNILYEIDGTAPSWYITTQTREQEKPACLHAFEHSHETCQACGKIVVLRSTSRLRAKTVVTRSKPNSGSLPMIQLYPTAEVERSTARLINGSLSQASHTGAAIFARTGRLRI